MKLLISNIQRFSLSDGPGIRTTVFFMGCPLNCFWCSNPENMQTNFRRFGNGQKVGKEYSEDEVIDIILKDRIYYKNNGGVTFSGGECLLYLYKNISLLRKLKENKIHICIETSLIGSFDMLQPIIEYIDLFFVDIKVLTKKSSVIHLNVQNYIENLSFLKKVNKKVIFRLPIVKDYNDESENIELIKNLVHSFSPLKLEIFSVHNLGRKKYMKLGLPVPDIKEVNITDLLKIKEIIHFEPSEILEI